MYSGIKMKRIVNQNLFSFQVKGEGEPVLCLSGFGCDHYNFEWLNFDAHMVMLDNRGMGQSENNLDVYSLEQLAVDAHELMLSLGFESYHVVGISMGGMIAQECVLQNPQSVKSLTLVCTTGGGPDFHSLPHLTENDLRDFYSLPNEKAARLAVNATCSDPQKIDEIIELRLKHPAHIDEVIKQKRAVDKYLKIKKELSLIQAPTLIITGDSDRYVPARNSKILKEKIPHSWLVEIEGGDHLCFFERPEIISAHVAEFLKGEVCYDLAQ